MSKIPVTLLLDDPAPRVHTYREHAASKLTSDGRPLAESIENDFLTAFCDVASENGVKGKFSVVPSPSCNGDIVDGIAGFPKRETDLWLETVKKRLSGSFDFCPEMITHNRALNLADGTYYDINENEWSKTQTRETLTPYIAHALRLLKSVGINATGVTSPWSFGSEVEEEYRAAISVAMYEVYGASDAWYFLHCWQHRKNTVPWKAYERDGRRLVSIPAAFGDHFWQTIDKNDSSPEYAASIADSYIGEDGSGEIAEAIENGSWVVLLTHWQSLYSNGGRTGLNALRLTVQRINRLLGDTVEWKTCSEITNMVLN